MSLGLESGTVRVVPYDLEWPTLFAAEASRLRALFEAAGLPIVLEHIGSTSVPGLAAKPILDVAGGYPQERSVREYIAVFEAAGYVHRGEQGIPGREFFRRGDPRAYHVHLTRVGSRVWWEHLTFRDALRASPALRDGYAALKHQLAAAFPYDRESYIEGKADFVRRVLDVAAS